MSGLYLNPTTLFSNISSGSRPKASAVAMIAPIDVPTYKLMLSRCPAFLRKPVAPSIASPFMPPPDKTSASYLVRDPNFKIFGRFIEAVGLCLSFRTQTA